MRIAVTGSSGNVGAATVHYILEHGGEAVSILGLDITAPTQILPDSLKPRFEFKRLDSTVYDDVHQAFRGCDAIIHCAALPTVGKFPAPLIHNTYVGQCCVLSDLFGLIDHAYSNVVSSYNALHAAASLGITRVVQLSSINAIGACYTPYLLDFHYLPLDESHPFIGADPYALSKQVCELQADQIARAFPNTRIASIRPHACLEQPPSIPESPESLAKYGRTYSWDSQINVNDVFGWVVRLPYASNDRPVHSKRSCRTAHDGSCESVLVRHRIGRLGRSRSILHCGTDQQRVREAGAGRSRESQSGAKVSFRRQAARWVV